jgi:hypothetical protein
MICAVVVAVMAAACAICLTPTAQAEENCNTIIQGSELYRTCTDQDGHVEQTYLGPAPVIPPASNPVAPQPVGPAPAPATPPPDPACLSYGTGVTHECSCFYLDDAGLLASKSLCAAEPTATPTKPAPPSQADVRKAANDLQLPLNTPVITPDPANNEWDALAVGFPIWLSAGDVGQTITATATTPAGIALSMTATWASTTFHMGESGVTSPDVTCATMPAPPSGHLTVDLLKSTPCGYVYQHKGTYAVTATTAWNVAWTANGYAGVIIVDRTATVADDLAIVELHAVNVPVPG